MIEVKEQIPPQDWRTDFVQGRTPRLVPKHGGIAMKRLLSSVVWLRP